MMDDNLYKRYFEALLAGRRPECHALVLKLLDAGIDIKTLYTNLFQRSLYEVGELWEANRISVANEHLASAITESLLNLVHPKVFGTARIGKKAVIACCADEFHQIGGKMVADILELHGWDGHFLGANTPIEALMQCIDEVEPDIAGLSLSILSNMPRLTAAIDAVRTDFPSLDLAVGGQAFRWGGSDTVRRYAGVVFFPSLGDFELSLKESRYDR